MQRIIFFTKYTSKGPSSRYRTYQYLDDFKKEYSCLVFPFFDDEYIDRLYAGCSVSFLKILYYYLRRIWYLLSKPQKKDIVFVEYELIPYFFAWAEFYLKLRGIKYIVDYDDAIFHNYDESNNALVRFFLKSKIPKVMRLANHVITGSPYLTTFTTKYNKQVTEIPTSVPMKKYERVEHSDAKNSFVVGWIGTRSTSNNLLLIKDALKEFSNRHSDVVFQFVGIDDRTAKILGVVPVKWEEEIEARLLSSFSVGIMPLVDNDFNKGKCGFKLIQYMACGLPTISTPLEANLKINRNKNNLHATTNQEWFNAFEQVYNNQSDFAKIGESNRKDIANYYSVEANAPIYKIIFRNLITIENCEKND